MLREFEDRGIPGIGLEPSRIVDGKTQIVSDLGTGYALRLVFGKPGGPFSGRVDLGNSGNTCYKQKRWSREQRESRVPHNSPLNPLDAGDENGYTNAETPGASE
jgi:hypothetical protein